MGYWNYYRSQEPEDPDNKYTENEENTDSNNVQENNSDRTDDDSENTDFYEGMEYMNRDDSNDDYGYEAEGYNYMDMMVPPCCPYREYMFRDPDPQPFGPPGPPQGSQFGPPGQQHGPGRPPSGPPPSVTPNKAQAYTQHGPSPKAVSPGTLRPCLFRFVYIWPERGRGFWAWLTFVDRRSVAGFRWNGRRWVYFGMDLRRIDSFICY